MLAPRLSLTAAMLWGEGYRSVVLCSGTQMVEVTIAPDGTIVTDVTQQWTGPQCVVSYNDVVSLQRAWDAISYPMLFSVAETSEPRNLHTPRPLGHFSLGRDPPRS